MLESHRFMECESFST